MPSLLEVVDSAEFDEHFLECRDAWLAELEAKDVVTIDDCIMFGSATSTKQMQPSGDSNGERFSFASRPPYEAEDDVALTIFLLGDVSGVWPKDFVRAVLEPEFAKQLLGGRP